MQQVDPWYPNTLVEVLTALAASAGIIATALGIVKRLWITPLEAGLTLEKENRLKDMNGMGNRIAEIATEATKAVGRVEIIERGQDGVRGDCADLHETVGELKALTQTLATQHQQAEIARVTDLGNINAELSAIKTELRLMREARSNHQREERP